MKYSEQLWELLGFLSVTALATFVFISIFSNHSLNGYYFEVNEEIPTIYLDVEWGIDGMIKLDRDISYDEAIELVNKLNKSLKNK